MSANRNYKLLIIFTLISKIIQIQAQNTNNLITNEVKLSENYFLAMLQENN